MNKSILSYATVFVSFLLGNLEEKDLTKVKQIILFGSAARGEATRRSDVDIFVNMTSGNKGMEKRVSAITEHFYDSELFRQWELKGVENEIRCIAGRLDNWKEIKNSVISDGICLYGKYTGRMEGEPHVVFFWERIKPESKRVLLSKRLYGFTQNGKKYRGLVEECGASKMGSNCIIVPLKEAKRFNDLFNGMGITARSMHVEKV